MSKETPVSDQTTADVDRIARALFIRWETHDGSSKEWATRYWDQNANAEHKGDCPHAALKGPITCDRCACDEFRVKTRIVLEEIDNVQ